VRYFEDTLHSYDAVTLHHAPSPCPISIRVLCYDEASEILSETHASISTFLLLSTVVQIIEAQYEKIIYRLPAAMVNPPIAVKELMIRRVCSRCECKEPLPASVHPTNVDRRCLTKGYRSRDTA
jgi:ribosomal protein L40E